MGDALNEFLSHSLDRGDVVPSHGGNKPHIVITVKGEHWMTGTGYGRFMMSQQPVSMQTLYRIANDAIISVIERDVDPDDPKDVRRVRKVTGWLRLQLQIRDGGCTFPGCDKPPSDCEAHHILAWHRGGPTVLKNLVLLCRHHHKLMDHPDWVARINPEDNLPEFIPPTWVDETNDRSAIADSESRPKLQPKNHSAPQFKEPKLLIRSAYELDSSVVSQ